MEIRERYLALYTGAIADIPDKRGLREQVPPRGLGPGTAAVWAYGGSVNCAHWGR